MMRLEALGNLSGLGNSSGYLTLGAVGLQQLVLQSLTGSGSVVLGSVEIREVKESSSISQKATGVWDRPVPHCHL